ncbi:hypothetical protein N665_0434s0005 [Sinapis alba]|nr:hypothetical protein N665_0434s0005 [Sinapis alba]
MLGRPPYWKICSDHRRLFKHASKFLTGSLREDIEEGIRFGLICTSFYDGVLALSWDLEDETEVGGGDGRGRKRRSGGRSGGDDDGEDSIDVHYLKMIEANPRNGIFLSSYAKFLKEVRKDYLKAEEYCGRAVLLSPNDGNVLAMYAELVWMIHKDSSHAESYFNRAVAAASDDWEERFLTCEGRFFRGLCAYVYFHCLLQLCTSFICVVPLGR